MKRVLQSTDSLLIESVRLALAAEGIGAVIKNGPGSSLPFIPAEIFVADEHYEHAREIIAPLEGRGPRLLP